MTDRFNYWRSLVYHDPAHVLREFRRIELSLPPGIDPIVARLRTPGLKPDREGRDAALFTYAMCRASAKDIRFARAEDEDYDFVTCWQEAATSHYTPVQLKELVPEDLNPRASLPALFEAVAAKYAAPTTTVLAVRLNRTAKLSDLLLVEMPPLGFAEVWYFCSVSADAQRWALFGDAKSQMKQLYFDYPQP